MPFDEENEGQDEAITAGIGGEIGAHEFCGGGAIKADRLGIRKICLWPALTIQPSTKPTPHRQIEPLFLSTRESQQEASAPPPGATRQFLEALKIT